MKRDLRKRDLRNKTLDFDTDHREARHRPK